MVGAVWTLVCCFFAVGLELVVGNYGFALPIFACMAFCLITALGAQRVFPLLALGGAVLDLSYARGVPAQLLLLPLLVVVSNLWRKHGDCVHPLAQFLPGCIVGAISSALLVLLVRLPGSSLGWDILWRNGWIILQGLVGGALLMPGAVALTDGFGKRFGLALYAKARSRGGQD
jgi:hypothetical protein